MEMKLCTTCNKTKPVTDFYNYPSGTVKAKCRMCTNEYLVLWRKKGRPHKSISVDYTAMRYFDGAEMEKVVLETIKEYEAKFAVLEAAGLTVYDRADKCDEVLNAM